MQYHDHHLQSLVVLKLYFFKKKTDKKFMLVLILWQLVNTTKQKLSIRVYTAECFKVLG